MKVIVVSDSHGNIANLNHVLGFAKEIKTGAIFHCGDWNNVESVDVVLDSGIPLYAVLGNADGEPGISEKLKVNNPPSGKSTKFNEKFLEVEIGGKKIGVIHNLKHLVSSIESLDILFHGHTHRQEETTITGVKVVNPGALENSISFAVYDTVSNSVELITDFEKTANQNSRMKRT